MTIATIGLFVFVLFQIGFVKKRIDRAVNYFTLLIFFELFANAGKMLAIGGVEIQYSDVLWGILFVFSLKKVFFHPVQRRSFLRVVIFVIVLFVLLVRETAIPIGNGLTSIRSILIFARFLIMVLVSESVIWQFSDIEIEQLLRNVLKLQKCMYIFVVFEVLLKVLNSNIYFNLISVLFGYSENQVNWLIIRGGIPAIQGLCKEPSHFAICLLFVSVFDLWIIKKSNRAKVFFFINCALLLVSGSFSSILFICALTAMYLIFTRDKNTIVIVIAVLIAGVPIALWFFLSSSLGTYYFERLTHAISITRSGVFDSYTSEGQRLLSINSSLEAFAKHPIFGNGIGNNVNTGAFPALLSSLGLIGTISYGIVMIRNTKAILPLCIMLFAAFFTMDMGLFYSSYFMLFIILYEKSTEKKRFVYNNDVVLNE